MSKSCDYRYLHAENPEYICYKDVASSILPHCSAPLSTYPNKTQRWGWETTNFIKLHTHTHFWKWLPFPYFLPTFSLAPLFLEVGWQWSWVRFKLKWPFVRNRITRTQFLCRNEVSKKKENARKTPYTVWNPHPPFRVLSFTVHVV